MARRHELLHPTPLCIAALLFALATPLQAGTSTDTLVARGSTWTYLDDGSDQGSAWKESVFNDALWGSGAAHIGYGDGDEVTQVGYGGNDSDKFITTYFRHTFNLPDPNAYTKLKLKLLRDDGAVVYLNGTEVLRSNLPAGVITSSTFAVNSQSDSEEDLYVVLNMLPGDFVVGDNVLAVEVHQISVTSSDISFDLELIATDTQFVTRGPYLQLATPTGVTMRWSTDVATNSLVEYGLSPGNLVNQVSDGSAAVAHIVELTSLLPDTRYYYAVGSTTDELAGDDTEHFFETPPLVGTQQPTRIWAIGDSGTADLRAASVRDAYADFTGSTYTDVWLLLGDNAYNSGTGAEYQAALYDTYQERLRQSAPWPTRGNHDTTGAYTGLFVLPTAGEAGGIGSGTELYYSFDHANIHFVCLDSESSGLAVGGTMWNWLSADLADTNQDWIIAFWHHPPYTKGSHDSDAEGTLITMRQNFVPLLESGGVDLVLNGHSHSYERSYFINGHHGGSSSWRDGMKKAPGNGQVSGTGAYHKAHGDGNGAVFCVAGSSGKTSSAPLDHPVFVHDEETLGSMVIDVDGDTLHASFLRSDGSVGDDFTMVKGPFGTWDNIGGGAPGLVGIPQLVAGGAQVAGSQLSLELTNAVPSSLAILFFSGTSVPTPFIGGSLHAFPWINQIFLFTDLAGRVGGSGSWPVGVLPGQQFWFQMGIADFSVLPYGASLSNAVRSTAP
jgi:hypothetical protein